ncbi:T9SS type A sorting domain-containing protein [Hymenobacter sp. BT175]|uniref:T9SS type A sorting domain-containing protein n=1 Tax=Hymenobacter translucens TaxID=2886507 RepID=UPI001D0F0814|nr:T9SS type A sorting domain-containing protein [Hymenobacter translucens]MCC2546559.1 T9SS type A sorting domain-containing protein [Hymenobacter translucens]
MSTLRQRILPLLVFGALLLPGRVFAQQDALVFQKQWDQMAREHARVAAPVAPSAVSALRNGPCDLAPNGDFEAQGQAPTRINNVGGGSPGAGVPNDPIPSQLQNWISPTAGTPDFYANNGTTADIRPATAIYGPFVPFAGQGSVGLGARMEYVDAGGNWRDRVAEYVEAPVSLTPGRYYGQFQVELTRNAAASNCGFNSGFGFQLSNGRLPGANDGMRDFLPLTFVGVLSTQPVDQSYVDSWHRVSGQFTVSGENTLTLGFFNPDSPDYFPLPGRNPDVPNTYVFVDNVELFRIPTAGPKVVCSMQAVEIGEGCPIPGATYEWRVRGTSTVISTSLPATVAPTTTTSYELTVILPDGSTYTTSTSVSACPAPPCPAGSGLGGQLEFASELGPIAYPPGSPSQNDYDDYCYSQRFSFTVPAAQTTGATGYAWVVSGFDVTNGNEVTGYTESGPTMSFVPISTYPNRLRNVNVTCIISYGSGCASGESYSSFTVVSADEYGNQCVMYRAPGQPKPTTKLAFPNPAVDFLTLPADVQQVELINQAGRVVLTQQQAQGGRLNVASLPEGLYMLRTLQEGKVATQRIQIRH